ncbi:CAF17-like 4Fe-4S cluster assembly/insertion protein YgfZ [Halomonas halmophila]|uniref:tRNA-modifying protein YgfZ n=1 Tax=Halomonas halmophila TaxID=252 RepID=A0A4Y4EWW9_9GAMM|nr:folate-binding protein YgfZ [Halomonas halmophila]GED22432.1 tRNA-modifying protein YgfZ [Halomonas halmophila]
MTDWIAQTGGRRENETRIVFDTPEAARQALEGPVMTPLAHLGMLDVTGEGAERFLQGQTSAQMSLVDGGFAPLGCFCTPKGRILANVQIWRVDTGHYRLLMHHELVDSLRQHLAKFAPFYKVELTDRQDLALIGLFGREAPAVAEALIGITAPGPWHQAAHDAGQLLGHPGPTPRLLISVPEDQAGSLWSRLADKVTAVDSATWRLQDIQAGLAWLDASQGDTYLPQMLNWEALGGISFKKGCYTGQEVVARAHFRGQVKKRLMRAQLEGGQLPTPGSGIVDARDKRLGEVVSAELDAYGQAEILAVMSTREPAEPLSVDGQQLKLLKLPYPIERLDPEQLAGAL